MTCLDDETVLGLLEGRLAAPQLAGIDEHLDACGSCRDVIAQIARTQSPTRVLERGQALGRYVIGELVGAGAMGRVYSAWEPELDRRVAIKVMQDDAPGARDRLVREAQAMARLDHPNVVGVHEVGTTEHGVYVTMELVDGDTLRAWAPGRPWRESASVLADVARGLAAVHAAGVLHRDIKPDNVIVGSDRRARLGDFGLARSGAVAAAPAGDAAVLAIGTPATSIAGTPVYMAPEVLRGGAATPASDQFGFGVTAYEVITGRRPFAGGTWAELASTVERATPARLRDAPGWLDAVIRRCLAADPARRFPSLADVVVALEAGLRRRRPGAWIAGAVAAAALASGVTWVASRPAPARMCTMGAAELAPVWSASRRARLPDGPARTAVDRWAEAWITERETSCRSAEYETARFVEARDRCLVQLRDDLAAVLARVDREPASAVRVSDALAAMPPSECVAAGFGAARGDTFAPRDPAEVVAIEQELPPVRAAIALGDARPVLDSLATLVTRARATEHGPLVAETLLLQSEAWRAVSRLAEAGTAARDAVAAAERGRDDQAAARAWIARVTIAGDRRDLAIAEDFAEIAAASIDRAGGSSRLQAQLLRLRGLVAYNRGSLAEARTLLLEARTKYIAGGAGERSVEVAAVESSLGTVARAAGDLQQAEHHHRLALELGRELRGTEHPDFARDLHNLAGVLRLRGELAPARKLYDLALTLEISTRGATSVEAALTHNSLGLVAMATRDYSRATAHLTQARDALRAAGHGDVAFTHHNLGLVAAATGDPTAALGHFTAAREAYAVTIGDAAGAPIRLHLDRARAELAAGQAAAARRSANLAREAGARAELAWLVEEATAFLAGQADRRAAVGRPAAIAGSAVRPAPTGASAVPPVEPARVERTAARPTAVPPVEPARADERPAAGAARPPPPQPRRDVGVYGSSQGW